MLKNPSHDQWLGLWSVVLLLLTALDSAWVMFVVSAVLLGIGLLLIERKWLPQAVMIAVLGMFTAVVVSYLIMR